MKERVINTSGLLVFLSIAIWIVGCEEGMYWPELESQGKPLAGSTGITAVVAADGHSCAIGPEGLKCWGRNWEGGLGNGTLDSSALPERVLSLGTTEAVGISSMAEHVCAIVRDDYDNRGLKCWGKASEGQLGIGEAAAQPTVLQPVPVNQMSENVEFVSLGNDHSCAVKAGMAYCWGNNDHGQLGLGDIETRFEVAEATYGPGVQSVHAGVGHSCVIADGALRCWGSNLYGQLGTGDRQQHLLPYPVEGMDENVTAVAAGAIHTCAIKSGGLYCWGTNWDGQLGVGDYEDHELPVPVPQMESGVTAVVANVQRTCAIKDEALYCFGDNTYGTLGDGTETPQWLPTPVLGMDSEVTGVATGYWHTCAIHRGAVKCWGRNHWGALGIGHYDMSPDHYKPILSYYYDCELDWNQDGVINYDDVLRNEDPIGGFYFEWYFLTSYPASYQAAFPHGLSERVDWVRDGVIDNTDVSGPLSQTEDTEGYYLQWYIYDLYPEWYEPYFPQSGCQATIPVV